MCEPTTILAIGSAVVGAVATRQQAKAQFGALSTQRQAQAEEISASNSAKLGERVKQGRAERARLRVAGGEAGISGNSFEAGLFDSFFQEDQDAGIIQTDARFAQRGSEARFQSGVASVRNPSLLESGLQIASAGASAHSASQAVEARIPSSELQIPPPKSSFGSF